MDRVELTMMRALIRWVGLAGLVLAGLMAGLETTATVLARAGLGWFAMPVVFGVACVVAVWNELRSAPKLRPWVRAAAGGLAAGALVNGLVYLWPVA